MAINIISAIRGCDKLKGNLKFTALEVAHRLNAQGHGRLTYTFMALKTGYCRRTAINHMHRLVELGIFRKTVTRLRFGHAWNHYQCLLPLPPFYRTAPVVAQSESTAGTLPAPKTEEKALSLEAELERARKGLRFLTNPDSSMYQACLEKITALEALRRSSCPATT